MYALVGNLLQGDTGLMWWQRMSRLHVASARKHQCAEAWENEVRARGTRETSHVANALGTTGMWGARGQLRNAHERYSGDVSPLP